MPTLLRKFAELSRYRCYECRQTDMTLTGSVIVRFQNKAYMGRSRLCPWCGQREVTVQAYSGPVDLDRLPDVEIRSGIGFQATRRAIKEGSQNEKEEDYARASNH